MSEPTKVNAPQANGKDLLNLDTLTQYPTLCNNSVKYKNEISFTHTEPVEVDQVIKLRNNHYIIKEILESRKANGAYTDEALRPTFYTVKVMGTTL